MFCRRLGVLCWGVVLDPVEWLKALAAARTGNHLLECGTHYHGQQHALHRVSRAPGTSTHNELLTNWAPPGFSSAAWPWAVLFRQVLRDRRMVGFLERCVVSGVPSPLGQRVMGCVCLWLLLLSGCCAAH